MAWSPILRIRGRILFQESLQRGDKNLTGWTQLVLASAAAPLASTGHRPPPAAQSNTLRSPGFGRYARMVAPGTDLGERVMLRGYHPVSPRVQSRFGFFITTAGRDPVPLM